MAQLSGFWTTTGGTPAGDQQVSYTQSQLAQAYKVIAACSGFEGVAGGYMKELNATVPSANTVTIQSGGAVVDGHWFYLDAPINKTIPSATGAGNTRIDRIVLRCSWGTTFKADIVIRSGTNAANPSPPAITKTSGTTYDITLWQAKVTTGGVVTLTDERTWAKQKDIVAIHLKVFGDESLITEGIGKLYWGVIEPLDGYKVTNFDIVATTPSTSGVITGEVQYNSAISVSVKPQIYVNERTSYTGRRGEVINNLIVNTGGLFRFDVSSAGTGARGLEVVLVLEK